MNLVDELELIFAGDLTASCYAPLVALTAGRRLVHLVSHEALCENEGPAQAIAEVGIPDDVWGLRVIRLRHLPVGRVIVLPDAGTVLVGIEELGRSAHLLAEARNDARAIVRRNLAAELDWLGMRVIDEPTTPEEALAIWGQVRYLEDAL